MCNMILSFCDPRMIKDKGNSNSGWQTNKDVMRRVLFSIPFLYFCCFIYCLSTRGHLLASPIITQTRRFFFFFRIQFVLLFTLFYASSLGHSHLIKKRSLNMCKYKPTKGTLCYVLSFDFTCDVLHSITSYGLAPKYR